MATPLMTFVRKLFAQSAKHDKAHRAEDKKHLKVTGEEQDRLDKERSDWEGMTPNNP